MLIRLTVAAFAIGVVVQSPAGSPGPGTRVERLAWLAGCWEQAGQRSTVTEQWMKPAGGTLVGTARTVRHLGGRDTTVSWEFTRIFERDDRLVFAALPSGQRYAEFVESELSDTSVAFTNPAHDFPQVVAYRRGGTDSLAAVVSGAIGGSSRAITFRYARVRCEGAAPARRR